MKAETFEILRKQFKANGCDLLHTAITNNDGFLNQVLVICLK